MRNFTPLLGVLAALAVLAAGAVGCSPKGKKKQINERARKYFQAGQYDKAEPEYVSIARADPGNADALAHLGMIYFDQGRMELAGNLLSRASQIATNNLDVRVKLGTVYLVFGGLKQAREEAVYVLERRPADEDAPLLLVETIANEKDLTDARQLLQKLSPPTARSAACEVALAALSLRQRPPDIAAAEAGLKLAQSINPRLPALYSVIGGLCRLTNGVTQADQALQTAANLSLPRSPRRLQYAEFKMEIGDLAGAKKILREITEKTPDLGRAWLELAQMAANERKFDEALSLVHEQLTRDPDSADGVKLGAAIKLAQGHGAEALIDLEQLVKRFPKSAPIRFDLARAYNLIGDQAKAASQLREVLALQPGDPQAITSLAQLDMNRGDLASGIAALKAVVEKQPQLVPAQLLLAQGYHATDDLDAELRVFRQLERVYTNEAQFPAREGLVLLEQNQRAEARKAFEKALALAPKYPGSLMAIQELIGLDLLEKQATNAQQRVDKLIAESPGTPEPRMLQAGVLLAGATPEATNQAVAAFLEVTKLKPDYWPAYLALAQLYQASHQNQKALEDLRQIVAKNPRDKVAQMMIGLILFDEKDYAGARDSYEKVLELDPQFSQALNNLAYLYSEKFNDPERAYKLASQARELMPLEPATADTLGWVLFHRHQFGLALNLLEESANQASKEPEILYHLGMVQYMMGSEAAATRSLKRALELSKDFAGRGEAEKRLAMLALDPNSDASVFEKRIAEQPGDVVALGRLATIYERKGEFEKAAQSWQASLKANPENVGATIRLAQLLADTLKQPQKAYELAQAAYKVAPNDSSVLYVYGRLAFQSGDHALALDLLREAARQQPNDPAVQFARAEAAYAMGEVAEAGAAMRTALKLPGFKSAEAANLFLLLTDPASPPPVAAAEKALAAQPGNVPALMVVAGQAESKGDLKEAKKTYEKVFNLYPHFIPALKQLAILYSAEPDNAKMASKLAVEASAALPGDLPLTKAMGTIAYHQKDWARAARLLEESMSKDHGLEDAKSRYFQGVASFNLKDKAASRAAFQRAVDLHLGEPELSDARLKLGGLK